MGAAAVKPGGAIGRFNIIRLLGKGNQSEVYLAYDPHLDRDVAIKTLYFQAAQDKAEKMASLLAEARTVSKLQHPNMVTLYDAGEFEGHPYLVFEYIKGPTLAQLLQESGPISPNRAAELAIQILDAIGYAHSQGIVHRDIKPSNVLMDPNGVARVMDFGVACRIDNQQSPSGYLTGTPAYMAPEYISEEKHGPKSDLFSFGMMLHEMLTGKQPVRGKDVHDVMRRILSDPIPAPSAAQAEVDERLDDIVLKSLRKDPEERYADVVMMKEAVQSYLSPEAPEFKEGTEPSQSTLEFLLRRMRVKSDFPALSESISAINRIASSDKESVDKLSNSILKDVALTNKLLKLINSVTYSHFDNGGIGTVSRAVVILGFDSVRAIALSLMLFENLQNKSHAQQLKEEFVRSLFSGMLARSMGARMQVRDKEEAFICSMFHQLGRMLSMFYFPEETAEIHKLMETKGFTEEKAANQVLGLTFVDLGVGVAKTWGFPDSMMLSMKPLSDDRVKKPVSNADRLRVLSGFSNELAAVITTTAEKDRGDSVMRLSQKFGDCLTLTEKQIGALVEKSLQDIAAFAGAVNVNLNKSQFASQAQKWVSEGAAPAAAREAASQDDTETALAATLLNAPTPTVMDYTAEASSPGQQPTTEEIQSILTSGLQEIVKSLVDDNIPVNDILRMILETMYSGLAFKHVLFCIKDGRSNRMMGKFGFGEGAQELIKGFEFSMVDAPDVFHVALKNNADILISNIDDAKISSRIPEWYRKAVPAKTFLIFPIVIKGKPVGMIYADKANAGEITVPEKELNLLKALRNQAVLAIKQSL